MGPKRNESGKATAYPYVVTREIIDGMPKWKNTIEK